MLEKSKLLRMSKNIEKVEILKNSKKAEKLEKNDI